MAQRGLYFKDVQPLVDQGTLLSVGGSDLLQVVKPCEIVFQRPALRRKAKQPALMELEEKVEISKGILLAPYWRKVTRAEQQKLEGLTEAELEPWCIRREKGEFRIKVLSQIRDIHAAIRQSLRHIPRNFLGQQVKFTSKTFSLLQELQPLASLEEELLNLNASIIELATAPPSAVNEVIESLAKFYELISTAIEGIESLRDQARSRLGAPLGALSRLLTDLRIMEKHLRRAEKLIAYDKALKEKIGWGYEKLMEIVRKAREDTLTDEDVVRAHGIYKFLTHEIHVNPYYAERIGCREFQKLGQIKDRSTRTALNSIKSAAFKLEAVALPIVQQQVIQKRAYYQQAIKEFSSEIHSFSDLSTLLKQFAQRVQQVLKSESVAIFLDDSKSYSYVIQEKLGLADHLTQEVAFRRTSRLVSLLKQQSKVWPLQELVATASDLENQELERLKGCKSDLLVPMIVKDDLAGFLSISENSSQKTYDKEALTFLLHLSNQAALAMESLRLRRQQQIRQQEFDAAREIQRNLLPRATPKVKGCEIAVLCESCLEVGGDYYDLLKFGDQKVGIIVADVVGKGAPAALLMSNLQAVVKALVTEDTLPDKLVEKINNFICPSITSNRYITLFYCMLDTHEKVLTYTSAGHNPPLLFRADGSYRRLDSGGPVIGVFPTARYEMGSVPLHRGDLLTLYTDGVTEALNLMGEEFGETRLCQHILAKRWKSLDELLEQLHQSVKTFTQGEAQDDLTLVLASIL